MHLLDGNVLIALVSVSHGHHPAAGDWMGAERPFATCPSTHGTLVRVLMQGGLVAGDAWSSLRAVTELRGHEFWPDDVSYLDVPMRGVIGHRQVTDAYLAEQARRHAAKLATFDRGFAALYPDVVDLVPT